MKWRDFPLPDGSYSDDTRPWTQQDVCNYLPTFAEGPGTRSRVKYATAPGLRTWAVVGDGPHRGARDVEGKRFVVSGNKLYQVTITGVATLLGTIPGTRRVSMTHNQIAGGNELVIATGDNSYVWNTVAGTLTATGVPLLFVDFINQMIVGIDVARRFWRYSGLADATSWNALDNESAESSPDRLVGLLVSQGEVLLFGERTIEVWSNSPTDNTSFQRSTVIEKGCANGNTCCRLDNTVYFVGNDSIPYRLQGYTPVPIASKAITEAVSGGDPDKLFAFTWEDRGYVCYYLTAQDGSTWGFDVTCQKWHRRESFGLSRWRINTLVKWGGSWYAGDYSSGKMYRLEWGYVYEGGDIFPRSIRTGVMHSNGNRVFIHALRLFAATGAKPSDTSDPVSLSVTGDMGGGTVGDASSGSYLATGGVPQYTFAVQSGALPDGITLASDGSWSGTFSAAGDFSWVVAATDDAGTVVTVSDGALVETVPVTYAAAVAIQPADATAMTLTVPEGVQAGDILVMATQLAASGESVTLPIGWTSVYNTGTYNSAVAYKAYAGETTVTFTRSGAASRYAAVLLWVRAGSVSGTATGGYNVTDLAKTSVGSGMLVFALDASRVGDAVPPADFTFDAGGTVGTWAQLAHSYWQWPSTETNPQIQVFVLGDSAVGTYQPAFNVADTVDVIAIMEFSP